MEDSAAKTLVTNLTIPGVPTYTFTVTRGNVDIAAGPLTIKLDASGYEDMCIPPVERIVTITNFPANSIVDTLPATLEGCSDSVDLSSYAKYNSAVLPLSELGPFILVLSFFAARFFFRNIFLICFNGKSFFALKI